MAGKKFLHFGAIAFAAAYVLSLLLNLGLQQLMAEEPRRATISIEMLLSENYFHSTLLGYEYYNKPPLFNWILIGLIKLFGSTNEFVMRLPSVTSIIILGITHYFFVRKNFTTKHLASYSAFMLITFADVYLYGIWNGAEIDIFFALVSFLQIAFLLSYAMGSLKGFWAFTGAYIMMAAGILTKGLPSVVFMFTTLIVVWWYTKNFTSIFNLSHLAGILLFFGLAFLFFYGFDDHRKAGLLISNLLFEATSKTGLGNNVQNIWVSIATYPLLLAKALLPWSLVLLVLFKTKVPFFKDRKIGLIALVFLLNIPLYWFTGTPKLRYIYPLLPFIAILFTHIVQTFYSNNGYHLTKKYIVKTLLAIAVTIAVAALGAGFWLGYYWVTGLVLVFLLSIINYIKAPQTTFTITKPVVALTLIIIAARLVFAGIVIPYGSQHPKINYKETMRVADSATAHNAFKFYGKYLAKKIQPIPYINMVDTLYETKPMSYQIPYYYYKQFGKTLQFTDSLNAGGYYIAEIGDVPLNADTLLRFKKITYGNDMMLFKY